MEKEAIVTCGFPFSGKTEHHQSFYSDYEYFDCHSVNIDILEDIKTSIYNDKNIFIEADNASVEQRKFYIEK